VERELLSEEARQGVIDVPADAVETDDIEAAIATLRRAANEKEVLVRNAVNRALRGGTA
jgi:hypothetical protein